MTLFLLWSRSLVAALMVLCCGFPGTADAAGELPSIFRPQGVSAQRLHVQLEYLEDQNGTYTLEQVMAGEAGAFKPFSTSRHGYDFDGKRTLWIRFAADFSEFKEAQWFLTQNYVHVLDLRLFYPGNKGYQSIQLTEELPIDARPFRMRSYLFDVPTPASSPAVYYMRYVPGGHWLNVDLTWYGQKAILETVHDTQLMFGLFFGALMVMWFYNAILFVYLKDAAYFYYVYYLGSFIATFIFLNGFTPFLFDLNPFVEHVFAACTFGFLHGSVLFARQFLGLKASIRWLDNYLRFFQWVLFIGIVATFFMPIGRPYQVIVYLVVPIAPFLMLAGFMRWYQGYEPARLYCVGWVIFAVAMLLLALRTIGVIPTNAITNYSIQFASVWEAVFFAIALAYRIKLIETEKKTLLEAERSRLEERVAERTQELQASTEELQNSLKARRLIVANASHELRTPVNALRLLVDSWERNDDRFLIENVQAIADHMSQLVDTLLLLDPDAPPSHLAALKETFDLGLEIAEAATSFLKVLQKGPSVELHLETAQCMGVLVNSRRSYLHSIISNLVSNAFKYTEQGTVSVYAGCEPEEGSDRIICSVRVVDTGKGVSDPLRTQIFEPWVTTARTDGRTGTGLGLAIARQTARKLGGDVVLESTAPGEGSAFLLTLPFMRGNEADVERVQGEDAVLPLGSVHGPLAVLLAEDDPTTAEAMRLIIECTGNKVHHVSTYHDLCAALNEADQFDMAFVDQRLPGGSGIEAVLAWRAKAMESRLRTVLLTADVTHETLDHAKTAFDEILTKPTTANRIRRLLGCERLTARDESSKVAVIDPTPLMALYHGGAHVHTLQALCQTFRDSFDGILRELSLPAEGDDGKSQRSDLIHRACSACATMGAVALHAHLRAVPDGGPKVLEKWTAHAAELFKTTQDALTGLLTACESQNAESA